MPALASWPALLSPWEWTSTDWAGLTFVVIFAALLVAWRQAVEARRLREEQARPFVVIDFDPWRSIIDLTVTNIGKTLARDVQFEFDPPLASTHDTEARGQVKDLNLLTKGIQSLAPGKEMRLFFDRFPPRVQQNLPMTYDARVSYKDPGGKSYSEHTVLDLLTYYGTGGVRRNGLHEIHKEVKIIAESIKRWTDWNGLKIVTQEDIDKRDAEWEAEREERLAAREAEASTADSDPAEDNSPA